MIINTDDYVWSGIYLEGRNWSLHYHPTFHYKHIKEGDHTVTKLSHVTYEWVMFNRAPEDELAESFDEIELLEKYEDSLRSKFARMS